MASIHAMALPAGRRERSTSATSTIAMAKPTIETACDRTTCAIGDTARPAYPNGPAPPNCGAREIRYIVPSARSVVISVSSAGESTKMSGGILQA